MPLLVRRASFEEARRATDTWMAGRVDEEELIETREDIERAKLLDDAHQAFAKGDRERGLELYDQAIAATRDPAKREVMEERLKNLQERSD